MRHAKVKHIQTNPDPIYGNRLVAKLINRSMLDGKKAVAAKHVYAALTIVAAKTGQEPLEVFRQAVENIKPQLEVRTRRIGGAAYQVPSPVKGDRKESLAVRWLVTYSRAKSNSSFHSFAEKLASEIIDAFNNEGASIKKKEDTHKMAEANRAFAHFSW